MSFSSLLTKNIKIQRLMTIGVDKMAYSTVTACSSQIQPLSLEENSLYDGVYGKTFKIFVEADEDLQEGDRIRDVDSGKEYQVKGEGATTRSEGSISYKVAIVVEINQ